MVTYIKAYIVKKQVIYKIAKLQNREKKIANVDGPLTSYLISLKLTFSLLKLSA